MDNTVEWFYAAECDEGGISAWKSAQGWQPAYPEITGYSIQTLLEWGAEDLAIRCADWLLTQQNKDGSFNGLDGVPRPFDTSAIVEGLRAAFMHTGDPSYIVPTGNAIRWVMTQRHADGYLKNSPTQHTPEVYNLRASAIVENKNELEYWKRAGLYQRENRSHYLAYALEGMMNMGVAKLAKPHLEMAQVKNPGLIPFHVNAEWQATHPAFDLCASSQMGILYLRLGMDASKIYKAMRGHVQANGGIFQAPDDRREIAWAAKFWLDFKKLYNETDV